MASLAFADIATVFAFGHFSWWADRFCPGRAADRQRRS